MARGARPACPLRPALARRPQSWRDHAGAVRPCPLLIRSLPPGPRHDCPEISGAGATDTLTTHALSASYLLLPHLDWRLSAWQISTESKPPALGGLFARHQSWNVRFAARSVQRQPAPRIARNAIRQSM